MFDWILIIFAIAVIFGVIKIEELKALAEKILPKLKALLSEASSKVAELKKNWMTKKITTIIIKTIQPNNFHTGQIIVVF